MRDESAGFKFILKVFAAFWISFVQGKVTNCYAEYEYLACSVFFLLFLVPPNDPGWSLRAFLHDAMKLKMQAGCNLASSFPSSFLEDDPWRGAGRANKFTWATALYFKHLRKKGADRLHSPCWSTNPPGTMNQGLTTTPGTPRPTLFDKCLGSNVPC